MAKDKLNPRQKVFVSEYLVDFNATQAAIRAGYSKATAQRIGSENLSKPLIQEAITESIKIRSERVGVTADMVLARWWEIATTDVNLLVQYRRVNCHHCNGEDFAYQWTKPEFSEACRKAMAAEMTMPDASGGLDYDRHAAPNADCPECKGVGDGQVHINDTRQFTGGALKLFRNVHQGKDGLRLVLADQDKALENVARHLGMFKEDKTLDLTTGGKPLPTNAAQATQEEIAAAVGRALDTI